tara:strand:- start:430 stop:1770 length:1341 start_codon:yes stop_codon:yes gene_type:complete
MDIFPSKDSQICILGLGYVGIPLLLEILRISKGRKVIGFDIDQRKIEFLNNGNNLVEFGYDSSIHALSGSNDLVITSDSSNLVDTKIFIVTVPTPINEFNVPDLAALKSASKTIGHALSASIFKKNEVCLAIFESTVFPGATEEICLPIIKSSSGDNSRRIRVGYSPERINPGDTKNQLTSIVKVTSGQDKPTSEWVNCFYKSFVSAGTFLVDNIKIAEASKVIENTQRDLNIALANELSLICSRLNIDTNDVLDAACTKWNFMNIRPGLVGGHCIGVDPYYLAHKAESLGIHSKVILSGRQVNDGMPGWIARRAIKLTVSSIGIGKPIKSLVLGMTFKENCEDIRNSKAIELFKCLQSYGSLVHITDPMIEKIQTHNLDENGLSKYLFKWDQLPCDDYDLIILAVPHTYFSELREDQLLSLGHKKTVFFDLKNCLPRTIPNLIRL